MRLTKKQKIYIQKHYKKESKEKIVKKLNITENAFDKYVHEYFKISTDKSTEKDATPNSKASVNRRMIQENISDENDGFLTTLKKDYLWILLIFGLIFLVYMFTLGYDFVSDDRSGILLNRQIETLSYIGRAPLAAFNQLKLVFLHSLFAKEPWGYRLVNILIHSINTTFAYLIIKKIQNKKVALFGALLFAVHPILVESITWIAGGIYVFYSMFGLSAFYFYLLATESEDFQVKPFYKNWYYYLSLLLFVLSLFSSEKAVAVGVLFLAYEIIYNGLIKSWKRLVPYVLLAGIHVSILLNLVSDKTQILATQYYSDNLQSNPTIQVPIAITEYLKLIFYPVEFSFYQTELQFTLAEYIFRLVIFLLIVLFFLLVYVNAKGSIKKAFMFWEEALPDSEEGFIKLITKILSRSEAKFVSFWMLWFLIALGPTLTPFGVSWVVAERYVYLGSLGIFAIVGLTFYKLSLKESTKKILIGVFILIILGLSLRTFVRNRDWKNEDTLWIATVKTSPSGHQIHNNMGDVYSRHGDLVRAADEFKLATEIKPNYADAYHNLAITYQKLAEKGLTSGNEEEATKYINLALESHTNAINNNPILWQSYYGIGTIYFTTGDTEQAESYLNKALEIAPYEPNLLFKAGVIYYRLGDIERSKQMMNRVLQVDPQNAQAISALQEIQMKESSAETSE